MARKKRSREFKNGQVIDIDAAREERRNRRAEVSAKKSQKEKRPKEKISRRKTVKIVRRRVIYSVIFLIIVVIIGLSVYHLISLKMEEARAQTELEALEHQKRDLEEELSHIGSQEYIEQQARQELRMILPGEILYVLKEEEENAAED